MKIHLLERVLFIAIILGLVFGFAYSLGQQVLRQSANDPQIQIAQDAASAMEQGNTPQFLTANTYGTVELTKSLAPFLIIFDAQGNLLASTAELNGKTPVPPAGVLAYAKKHGIDKVTWQPANNVRIATVVVHYSGKNEGYALAGRSLAETENRSAGLEFLTLWAWLLTSIAASIGYLIIWEKDFVSSLRRKYG